MPVSLPEFTNRAILAQRPAKVGVDPRRAYAALVEPERTEAGEVVDVATIFLANSECPFRCLMCDLWQNTTDEPLAPGDVIAQIDHALAGLPPARRIKLYNNGNFFDPRAIPRADRPAIAKRAGQFERIIVENHPRFCSDECARFRDQAGVPLEIAIGLETAHPQVLAALNKQMTLDDFARAVGFLLDRDIAVRAFLLLKPPFLEESEGIEWAIRSMEYAFSLGVECCAIIPTRAGNGAMDRLSEAGQFAPPTLNSIETVLEAGIAMRRGRVFMDLWDIERFYSVGENGPARSRRLQRMNLSQTVLPPASV